MRLNIITGASDTGFRREASRPMPRQRVNRNDDISGRLAVCWRPLSRQISVSLRRPLQIAFFATLSLQVLVAQTNPPSGTFPANRFLLVVETSHAMQRRADGTLRAINDLIASRMRGQLRLGDSIGVWTFNETLSTGKLPLQEWSEGGRTAIADKILSFLQEQTYEKQGRLNKLLPALLQVVKKSEFITVILISEGSEDFQGTPFDQQINQSYKQWAAQQLKARMPFVTVLRAQRGQFTNYSVTPAPFAVEIPPLPVELVRPKSAPSLPMAAGSKPAPPMAPPLIISGRKSQPTPNALPNTNSSSFLKAAPGATNAQSGGLAAQSQQSDTSATSAVPTAPAQRLTGASPVGAASVSSSPPVTQALVTNEESKAVTKLPQQPAAATPALSTETIDVKSPPDVSVSNLQSNKPGQRPTIQDSHAVPVSDIAAAPGTPTSSPTILIAIISGLAALAAIAAIWLWKRRTRPAAHASLITRSLDRDNR